MSRPRGLFFTEMWERLAFYTMVGLLLLYTTDAERGGLALPSEVGNEIYGLYLAFVYFTPFLGGMIAWVMQLLTKKKGPAATEAAHTRGTLLSSGLIAGEALTGIGLAIAITSGMDLPV